MSTEPKRLLIYTGCPACSCERRARAGAGAGGKGAPVGCVYTLLVSALMSNHSAEGVRGGLGSSLPLPKQNKTIEIEIECTSVE